MSENKRLITDKDLFKSWLIWENFPQTCYNYERMMGQAVAHTFVPVIDKLHPNEPEKRKGIMKRQIEFFNVHIEFGAVILGMIIALEEKKSQGEKIPGEFITSLKTSLMGPLSGVGDTIWQGVVIPILLALTIDFALKGSVAAPIIYAVTIISLAFTLSYTTFMFGYRSGSEAVMNFLEKGILDKILKGAEIMGTMVMGGLISNYVHMNIGLTVESAGTVFNIQEQFFDALVPQILPFAFTLFIYSLMRKKVSSQKILLMIVAIGVIGGLFGILV